MKLLAMIVKRQEKNETTDHQLQGKHHLRFVGKELENSKTDLSWMTSIIRIL